MRLLIVLLSLLLCWNSLAAQTAFSAKKVPASQIPKTIKFKGMVKEAWTWRDKLGENILITSLVKPFRVKQDDQNEDNRTSELYAFHFIKKDTIYELLWPLSDAVKNCSFDITLEFISDAVTITDLDNNGIAETKVQYKLVCRSDVSPAGMKLVMHEDTVKYALRGYMWLQQGPEDKFAITDKDVNLESFPKPKEEWEQYSQLAGRYESEKDFKKATPVFITYARKEWLKYVKERLE